MRLQLAPTVLLTAALLLGGCAEEEPEAGQDTDTTAETGSAQTEATQSPEDETTPGTTDAIPEATTSIEITIEDGEVSPRGERVEVGVGEQIELVVNSDTDGELHVHSSPEQELTYGVGTTTLPLTIDQPGVVEVESHEAHQVIVQLQVQ